MGRKGHYQVETWWRDEVPDERKLWESKKMYSWPEVVQYIIDRDYKWRNYPIAKQVARIGNSVVPVMAQKLVEANCGYLKVGERCPAPILYTGTDGQVSFV